MSRYPITIYGIECHSDEDVRRVVRERRDASDRTPIQFQVTTTVWVEIDPLWLDDEGRMMWRSSPLEVGGETPLDPQHRKTPAEWLEQSRQRGAGSVFTPMEGKERKVQVRRV